MSAIGSVNALQSALLGKMPGMQAAEKMNPMALSGGMKGGVAGAGLEQPQHPGFEKLFEGIIDAVDSKQQEASALTKDVLLGKTDQLHQSVIAMQEASVSFSLMIEVRNKLVDSYQELMRMPV